MATLLACACAPAPTDPDPADTWVGTVSTEGDVTTVVNQAGSLWGGPATLAEELSIGVDQGEDAYMFGSVASVWATADRIYVVDARVPVVRVFNHQGTHLMDLGRRGEGPGEFQIPNAVAVLPDGRILVREGRPGQRMNLYAPDGEPVDTWYGDPMLGSGYPPTLTHDGTLYTQTIIRSPDDPEGRETGMGKAGPDGIEGEPLRFPDFGFEPPLIMVTERWRSNVPLAPRVDTTMLPSGALVAGLSSQYGFTLLRPDGSKMIVEKYWEPLRASEEELEWRRRQMVASGRRQNESFQWDGAEMPDHHPAFGAFVGDRSGRIWVIRRGAVDKVPGCTEDPLDESVTTLVPCWQLSYTADVFEEETGKFLGTVPLPGGVTLQTSFIEGEALYTPVEDAAGTILVKRYRLALPGRGEDSS
jgi:hypothetical protein